MVGWRAVLLVTIVKSSEVDCAVDDELIEAAAPLSNTPTVFELAVGRAFKWDRGAPKWGSGPDPARRRGHSAGRQDRPLLYSRTLYVSHASMLDGAPHATHTSYP